MCFCFFVENHNKSFVAFNNHLNICVCVCVITALFTAPMIREISCFGLMSSAGICLFSRYKNENKQSSDISVKKSPSKRLVMSYKGGSTDERRSLFIADTLTILLTC